MLGQVLTIGSIEKLKVQLKVIPLIYDCLFGGWLAWEHKIDCILQVQKMILL